MWAKIKNWLGWAVAILLACLGATAVWKRKKTQKVQNDEIKARIALERAVWRAAKTNVELDRKVEDARSRGTLADRFND